MSAEEVGIALAVVGLAFALGQVLQGWRNQRQVARRLKEQEESILQQVSAALDDALGPPKTTTVVSGSSATDHDHRFAPTSVAYADVDNDGYSKLLLQQPGAAAYTSGLSVYKMRDGRFKVIGSLGSHTHAGFRSAISTATVATRLPPST